MKDQNRMFEEAKVGNLLFKFSIPIIISMLVSELYNMVDTYFVGNIVGGNGIGGLMVVFPIQRIIIALSIMFGIGTSTSFSRANGEKDLEKSKKILENGISLTLFSMVALTVGISLFKDPVLRLLGASEEILPFARDYLRIVILGSTFLSFTVFTSHVMISLGHTEISIISTSIGAIMNVIIDYLLVVRGGMGVKGAAIATTVSQIIGFLYSFVYLRKLKKEYGISGLNFNREIIRGLILVGISSFVIESEDGIVMAVINNLLARSAGDNAIIVLGIASKIYMFLFITMFGMASAMQPILAYNTGAKNYGKMRDVVRKTIVYGTISTGVLWAIGMVFTEPLVRLFLRDGNGIVDEAVSAFRMMISIMPVISIYYVSIFYYQATGNSRYSVTVSILRQLIIMLPLTIYLVEVRNMGALGVWMAYPISDGLSAIISSVLMLREFKKLEEKEETYRAKEKKAKKFKEVTN